MSNPHFDRRAGTGASPTGGAPKAHSIVAIADEIERFCDLAAKEPQQLDRLFQVARPRLCKLVQVRIPLALQARVDAEDVVQETLATAALRFEEYLLRRQVPCFVWLRGLALDRLVDLQRRHLGAAKRAVQREQSVQQVMDASSVNLLQRWLATTQTPSGLVARKQQANKLNESIETLPPRYREVLMMRFFEAMTLQETASAIGTSAGNVKVLQYRALAKLKDIIAGSGPQQWDSADRRVH